MKIKALSLKQPYANLVCYGEKTLETRKWKTEYLGDILICASKSGEGEPKGVALCVVELTDIRPMTKEDEEAACIELYDKAKAWELENLRVLKEPFPVKGQLGLFELNVKSNQLKFE